MRVKTGRRVMRVKSPQYIGIQRKGKKPIKASNLGVAYQYKRRPTQLRIMTLETFIRKTTRVVKAALAYRKARKSFKDTKSEWQTVPFGVTPEKGRYNLIEIELNADGKKFLSGLKALDPLTYHVAVYTLSRGLRNTHTNIRYLARRMMGMGQDFQTGQVPKDTGALRRDLLNSLSSKCSIIPNAVVLNHNDLKLKLGFYSDLPYVDYLKKPFLHIKHHGKKRSRRTGIPLYDPGATPQFMKNITNALRRAAIGNFYTMCRHAAPHLGIPADYVKQMFKVKHIRGQLRTL